MVHDWRNWVCKVGVGPVVYFCPESLTTAEIGAEIARVGNLDDGSQYRRFLRLCLALHML